MPYVTGIPDTIERGDDGSHWDVREEPNGVTVRFISRSVTAGQPG